MKLHLDKTALDVYRMIPVCECQTVSDAVAALRKRFTPKDIEELRGLEFHHHAQGPNESVEQLGISIQQLGCKAFPGITGKDFDRLLKDRFYQALLVKWQHKLGCPKTDEGFHDLLALARMLEEHEKQFAASAQSQGEIKKTSSGTSRRVPQNKLSNKGGPAVEKQSERVLEQGATVLRERRCSNANK